MEMIQRFSGVLHQGYHGNIIYNFFLPSDLSSLSVVLTYQKEHPSDPDSYFNRRRTELAPILEQYMEQPVSEDLLRREINAIKTDPALLHVKFRLRRKHPYAGGSKGNDNFGKFCQPRLYPL